MTALTKTRSTSQYDDVIRQRTIAEYVVSGNVVRVSESVNIPRQTVQDWVKSEWGIDLIRTIRHEKQDELIAGYTNIIDGALQSVTERLTTGDYAGLDANGDMLYKPISARDSILIAAVSTDKMRLLSNQATSITVTDNALINISKQLAAFAVDKQDKCRTIDHDSGVSD